MIINSKLMNHQCDGNPCQACGSVIVTSATAVPSNTACAPQNCTIEFPALGWQSTNTGNWMPHPPRLSDEDIERIAKRVAELLKEQK